MFVGHQTWRLEILISKFEISFPKQPLDQYLKEIQSRRLKFTNVLYWYSWVPNRRVYSFIWQQRNMKKETDTKTDKSI